MATRLGNYKGVEVEVTVNGRFEAQVGDAIVTALTLDELKELIEKELRGLKTKKKVAFPVIIALEAEPDRYAYGKSAPKRERAGEIVEVSLVGFNRATGRPQLEGIPAGYRMDETGGILAATEPNRKLVREMIELEEAYSVAREAIAKRNLHSGHYGRIDADAYAAIVEKIEEKHRGQVLAALDTAAGSADTSGVASIETKGESMDETAGNTGSNVEAPEPDETREEQSEGSRDNTPADSNQTPVEGPTSSEPAEQ
jgi:hypothetical protein